MIFWRGARGGARKTQTPGRDQARSQLNQLERAIKRKPPLVITKALSPNSAENSHCLEMNLELFQAQARGPMTEARLEKYCREQVTLGPWSPTGAQIPTILPASMGTYPLPYRGRGECDIRTSFLQIASRKASSLDMETFESAKLQFLYSIFSQP